MKREEAIQRLRASEKAIRALGALHLYLFGSTARDEAHDDSDIDVFIDRDPNIRLGLLELGRMETTLGRIVGADVDLTTRGGLHPLIRTEVEANAIQVF